MLTLGIETSCDETGIGLIDDDCILANVVSSQLAHTKYGGVVPELAARNHIRTIIPVMKNAFDVARHRLDDVELISVTRGPGLMGALLVGLSIAKSLAIALKKPMIGVNHLEGHVYALSLAPQKPQYPYLILLVSGGHTELVLVKEEFKYQTLGRTVDDACGEAFDKVAKILGLPYPGGPYIEKEARTGNAENVRLPVPKPGGFNFSYAGLKTAVLYYTKDHQDYNLSDVAASFQESALEHLIQVTERALDHVRVEHLGVVGGVSVNKRLRERFTELSMRKSIHLYLPDIQHCTDNGVMIARAGARRFRKYGPSSLTVDAVAREALDALT
ncbi:MAG: tRNA (adenosine(37)-N6)-threonylcarbamoyltransferase complex transferase subunit TsaD [candidate division WOR-3 bacterium]|nr:MAG: tRNA (adenosine(37)-N6)-threonylcarbamoyltransferase complex transferase subunit TsaD [candidate division WOR-3 bacterium]